jgi:hypothetical protein
MRDQLDKHLSMRRRNGVIETWHDRRIVPGARIDDATDESPNTADIILLLISKDLLASDYCYSVEMRRALERHACGDAKVMPIILGACDWMDGPFGRLQVLPNDARPIASWADIGAAYLDVVEGLKRALPSPAASTRPSAPLASATTMDVAVRAARSSNMRVRKQFTDADRHQFLVETFEYLYRFFEGSVSELHRRHSDIDGNVTRLTARQPRARGLPTRSMQMETPGRGMRVCR